MKELILNVTSQKEVKQKADYNVISKVLMKGSNLSIPNNLKKVENNEVDNDECVDLVV